MKNSAQEKPFIAKTLRNKKRRGNWETHHCHLRSLHPRRRKKSFSEKAKIPLRAKKNFLGKVLPRFKQLQTRKTLPSSSPSTAQTGRHCKSDLWMVFPSVRIFYSPASENARELSWGEWKMEASRLRSEEEMRKIRISRDSFTRKQKNKSERLFQPSSLKRRRFFH